MQRGAGAWGPGGPGVLGTWEGLGVFGGHYGGLGNLGESGILGDFEESWGPLEALRGSWGPWGMGDLGGLGRPGEVGGLHGPLALPSLPCFLASLFVFQKWGPRSQQGPTVCFCPQVPTGPRCLLLPAQALGSEGSGCGERWLCLRWRCPADLSGGWGQSRGHGARGQSPGTGLGRRRDWILPFV